MTRVVLFLLFSFLCSTVKLKYPQDFLSPREALLDVLLAVHIECKNSDKLKREKAFTTFITKYDALVEELKELRLTKDDFEPKNVIGRGHFGEVRPLSGSRELNRIDLSNFHSNPIEYLPTSVESP